MKYLYLVGLSYLLMYCSGVEDNLSGRWINTSPEFLEDVGSIEFGKDVEITLANGVLIIPQMSGPKTDLHFSVNNSDSSVVSWTYLDHDKDRLIMKVSYLNEVDTVQFLKYEQFEPSTITHPTLKSLLVDNYWKQTTDSVWYQFLNDGTILKTSRNNGTDDFYRFEWEIFNFDSLFFLRTISVTPDVSLIIVESDKKIRLVNLEFNQATSFNIVGPDMITRAEHEQGLIGDWRLSQNESDLRQAFYKGVSFARVRTLKSFYVEDGSGNVKAGEWDLDYSGRLIIMRYYNEPLAKVIEVEVSSEEAVLCEDGFCYEFESVKN